MQLLVVLLPNQLLRLQAALGPNDTLMPAPSLSHVLSALRRVASVDAAVLNPAAVADLRGGPELHHQVIDRLLRTGIPVIAYLSPPSIRSSLHFVRSVTTDVIVEGVDDGPETLPGIVRDAQDDVCTLIITGLESRLRSLTPLLRERIRRIAAAPNGVVSATAFSQRVGIPERTLDRHLRLAGLPSPKVFVRFVRVVQAYRLLRRPGANRERVARSLGYSSARRLGFDIRFVLGSSAAATIRTLAPSEFARRVICFVAGMDGNRGRTSSLGTTIDSSPQTLHVDGDVIAVPKDASVRR